MSDIRHMSVAMQRLVDFISMVTQQYRSQHYATIPEPTVRHYATIPERLQLWKETAISVGSVQTLQLGAVTEEEQS
jgi:hypothetical protein